MRPMPLGCSHCRNEEPPSELLLLLTPSPQLPLSIVSVLTALACSDSELSSLHANDRLPAPLYPIHVICADCIFCAVIAQQELPTCSATVAGKLTGFAAVCLQRQLHQPSAGRQVPGICAASAREPLRGLVCGPCSHLPRSAMRRSCLLHTSDARMSLPSGLASLLWQPIYSRARKFKSLQVV